MALGVGSEFVVAIQSELLLSFSHIKLSFSDKLFLALRQRRKLVLAEVEEKE